MISSLPPELITKECPAVPLLEAIISFVRTRPLMIQLHEYVVLVLFVVANSFPEIFSVPSTVNVPPALGRAVVPSSPSIHTLPVLGPLAIRLTVAPTLIVTLKFVLSAAL